MSAPLDKEPCPAVPAFGGPTDQGPNQWSPITLGQAGNVKTTGGALKAILVLFLLVTIGVGIYNTFYKPLPAGLEYNGPEHMAWGVKLFKDTTYVDAKGVRQSRQEIFDEVFRIIRGARRLVVLDMFLYNDYQPDPPETTRAISDELTEVLLKHRARYPGAKVVLITDPINNIYGGRPSAQFKRLREAGVAVVVTDLLRLRDSNPMYSAPWRTFVRHFGNSPGESVPSPFGKGKVTIRSYMGMLNFKANHRKVLVADDGGQGLIGLVTSANPHDGSSANSNVALRFNGSAAVDLLRTERAVIEFSGGPDLGPGPIFDGLRGSDVTVRIVTEKAIKRAVLRHISKASRGDSLRLAMFYLSDRDVVSALLGAKRRGAGVRVVLDPNKGASGLKPSGVPNRQVARELHNGGVKLRWCDTHGEQCHLNMLQINFASGKSTLILGSANFTRRNLENMNLETNAVVRGPGTAPVLVDARRHFDLLWNNGPGITFSAEYDKYSDQSDLKVLLYKLMEASGVSTF